MSRRYLFDIVHPAHVHFYRHLIADLEAAGHETRIVARDKEVTLDLLRAFDLPFEAVGQAGQKGLAGLGRELVHRVRTLVRHGREFRPDAILTRNPAGAQAARLLRGTIGIFDTDNAKAAGIHHWAAAPFAHVITTPDCYPPEFGRRHVPYPSYKALAFLHPDRFEPDPSVLDELGVERDEPYFLVRLVAMQASHDRGHEGFDAALAHRLVEMLSERGQVFVSSEAEAPPGIAATALPTAPHRFHDVLAFAHLCVGDSDSVCQEAALLGVPSLFSSTFAGKLAPPRELERRYQLMYSFEPGRGEDLLEAADRSTSEPEVLKTWAERRERMLDDKVDLTAWYHRLLEARAGA